MTEYHLDYKVTGNGIPYNIAGDYYVTQVDDEMTGLQWRTHPDILAFATETDQDTYMVITVPQAKVLTNTRISDLVSTITVSDGSVQVY